MHQPPKFSARVSAQQQTNWARKKLRCAASCAHMWLMAHIQLSELEKAESKKGVSILALQEWFPQGSRKPTLLAGASLLKLQGKILVHVVWKAHQLWNNNNNRKKNPSSVFLFPRNNVELVPVYLRWKNWIISILFEGNLHPKMGGDSLYCRTNLRDGTPPSSRKWPRKSASLFKC